MRRLITIALLAGAAYAGRPKVTHGVGSGSDECGDFNYSFLRLRFGAWSMELDFWTEKVTDE